MIVLKILGAIVAAIVLYIIVLKINKYSERNFKYQFFSYANFTFSSIAYYMIFFGYRWYESALKKGEDILNGEIIISIGVLILLTIIIIHIKRTHFIFALFFSIVQFLIYIPASFVALVILLAALAWLSDTKPVYNLN